MITIWFNFGLFLFADFKFRKFEELQQFSTSQLPTKRVNECIDINKLKFRTTENFIWNFILPNLLTTNIEEFLNWFPDLLNRFQTDNYAEKWNGRKNRPYNFWPDRRKAIKPVPSKNNKKHEVRIKCHRSGSFIPFPILSVLILWADCW